MLNFFRLFKNKTKTAADSDVAKTSLSVASDYEPSPALINKPVQKTYQERLVESFDKAISGGLTNKKLSLLGEIVAERWEELTQNDDEETLKERVNKVLELKDFNLTQGIIENPKVKLTAHQYDKIFNDSSTIEGHIYNAVNLLSKDPDVIPDIDKKIDILFELRNPIIDAQMFKKHGIPINHAHISKKIAEYQQKIGTNPIDDNDFRGLKKIIYHPKITHVEHLETLKNISSGNHTLERAFVKSGKKEMLESGYKRAEIFRYILDNDELAYNALKPEYNDLDDQKKLEKEQAMTFEERQRTYDERTRDRCQRIEI